MEEPVVASAAKNSEEIKGSGVDASDDKSDDEEDTAVPKEVRAKRVEPVLARFSLSLD